VAGSKRHLHVLIDENIYLKLVALAPQLTDNSKYRGALSQVVEEALILYFNLKEGSVSPLGGSTHTQKAQKSVYNKGDKIKRAFNSVIETHKRLNDIPSNEIVCEITREDLVNAISLTIGHDTRTIDKWIGIFLTANLIKGQSEREPLKSKIFTVVDASCLDISDYADK